MDPKWRPYLYVGGVAVFFLVIAAYQCRPKCGCDKIDSKPNPPNCQGDNSCQSFMYTTGLPILVCIAFFAGLYYFLKSKGILQAIAVATSTNPSLRSPVEETEAAEEVY